MKTAPYTKKLIREGLTVEAQPRLIAEFNHNRYSNPTAANTPSEDENALDPDIFPIDSIVEPLRPRRGAVKATVDIVDAGPKYKPIPPATRFHIAEQEDVYKYWKSPVATGYGPFYDSFNLIYNPSTTNASITPWVANGVTGEVAISSVVQSGARAIKVEKVSGSGANFGAYTDGLLAFSHDDLALVGDDTPMTVSAEVMQPSGGGFAPAFFQFVARDNTNNDSTVGVGGTPTFSVPADGVWRRVSWTFNVKDARSVERIYITAYNQAAGLANGSAFYIRKVMLNAGVLIPFFDGDTADTATETYDWPDGAYVGISSKQVSNTSGLEFQPYSTGGYPSPVNPQVTYENPVKANKIVVGLENSVSGPLEFELYVKNTLAGSWTLIGDETTLTPDDDGRIILYWDNGWSDTYKIDSYTEIVGIQLRVTKMEDPERYLELIEMGARLEWDISEYVQKVEDTFDLGDVNVMTPIGRISSNVGQVSLFNALVDEYDYDKGLIFNNENTESLFYGLLDENVKFTLTYEFNSLEFNGNFQDPVRQFEMYTEDFWGSELESSFSVSLRDASKFLQETDAPETFYESDGELTVAEIVWMLLDSVGFVDYNIDANDVSTPMSTKFFWCDNEQKVWDVLSSLAEGTQTAIYFDEWGILQIKIKDIAFDPTLTPVWHIRGETEGAELADLIELDTERKEIPNTIKIDYKVTDYQKTAKNNFLSEMSWEPSTDTVILRSSDLQEPFLVGDEYLMILPHQATDWQYKGFVQIEGELIAYEGKEYKYLDSPSTTYSTVLITTHEQYLEYLYKTDHEAQYLNHFTGRLKVTERGMWNTLEKNHTFSTVNYDVWKYNGGVRKTTTAFKRQGTERFVAEDESIVYDTQKSSVRLISSTTSPLDEVRNAMKPGSTNGLSPRFMGTRFVIRSAGQKHHRGGLCFMVNAANGSGYYVDIKPEDTATDTDRSVNLYSMSSSGSYKKIGKGWMAAIVKDTFYNLDIQVSYTGSSHRVWIWLDGKLVGSTTISGSDKRANTDEFGMFIRGSSCFEYEYLYGYENYGSQNEQEQYWGDDVSFYDRVINGYTVNQSLNEFTAGQRVATRRVKKTTTQYIQTYNIKFFDEFVPVVHEMREFDVHFEDRLPGKRVRLLATNEATAKYLDFRGTPFGAHFYAINASHDDVEIHGENEKLGILVQNLKQGETLSKTFEDEESIRVSGKKETTFSSDWIQTEGQVTKLGEWIVSHWGSTTDEVSVTIFGNPLIQVTDTVLLTEPQSERFAEKYYVISVKNEFDQGLETELRLRKVKT